MLWYRHWLELRRPLIIVVAVAVPSGFFFIRRAFEAADAGMVGNSVRPFHVLLPLMNWQEVVALAGHGEMTVMLMWIATFALSGDGLSTIGTGAAGWRVTPGGPYLTLSLPVSRRRVVHTRLLAGCAASAAALAVSLGANSIVLTALGRPVPVVPMVAISGALLLMALLWSALFALMVAIAGSGWGVVLSCVGIMISTVLGLAALAAFLAAPASYWFAWMALLAVIGAAVYLLGSVIADEEF